MMTVVKKLATVVLKIISSWLFIVTTVYFLFAWSNPNIASIVLRVNNITPTANAIKAETQRLGLDQPLLERFFHWLAQALHGDFGLSFTTHESVSAMIVHALPNTLALAIYALGLIIVTIVLYGWLAIRFQNTVGERVARLVVFLLNAIPAFWLGLIFIALFAVRLNWFPVNGNDRPSSLVLPTLTLAAMYCGSYARLIRTEILRNKEAEYLRYYQLRGFSSAYCQRKLFKNSLQSVLVSLSMSIPKIIAGSAVVETVFGWPGMGQLCVTAISNRDLPVLEGYVAIMTFIFLACDVLFKALGYFIMPELRDEND